MALNLTGIFIMIKNLLLFIILFICSGCAEKVAEKGVFYTAGNWDIPPAYHGNPWAPGGVGVAGPFVHEPLFVYIPTEKEYIPRLGESFKEEPLTLTVTLKKGVTWHDGQKFTSRDVKTTFYTGYLKNWEVWRNLKDIECPDDTTVIFKWNKISPVNSIRVLTETITSPHHIFGQWADLIPDLREKEKHIDKKDEKSLLEYHKESQKVREILYKYHPSLPIGTGPFKIGKVTASDMLLDRYEQYYEIQHVHIKKIRIMRWGSNEVVWSYLMAGEMDAVAPACPYDVAQEILKRNPGTTLITPCDMSEFGLIYNCRKYPVQDLNFRKAIAHIINRDMVRQVAYSYGETVDDYSFGIPKSFRKDWLNEDFYKDLTRYDHNQDKAEKILLDSGYKKDSKRNVWLTPDGKDINLEIVSPAGLNDLILLAEASSAQLTKFGIPAQIRVIPLDLYGTILGEGNFDMAAENGAQLSKYGHPSISLNRFYYKGSIIGKASGLSSNINYKGREIDTEKLAEELNRAMDPGRRDEIVSILSCVTNEYLPFLTCYEKRIIIFTLDGKRVTGWPGADDKIWGVAPGGVESLYCTMMVKGMLKPAGEQ